MSPGSSLRNWGDPIFSNSTWHMVPDVEDTCGSGHRSCQPRTCPSRLGVGSPRASHHLPGPGLSVDPDCGAVGASPGPFFVLLPSQADQQRSRLECLAGCALPWQGSAEPSWGRQGRPRAQGGAGGRQETRSRQRQYDLGGSCCPHLDWQSEPQVSHPLRPAGSAATGPKP